MTPRETALRAIAVDALAAWQGEDDTDDGPGKRSRSARTRATLRARILALDAEAATPRPSTALREALEKIRDAHKPSGARQRCLSCGLDDSCCQFKFAEAALGAAEAAPRVVEHDAPLPSRTAVEVMTAPPLFPALATPPASEPPDWEMRLAHAARKQSEANGFQQGWHAALQRVQESDTARDLAALVPRPQPTLSTDDYYALLRILEVLPVADPFLTNLQAKLSDDERRQHGDNASRLSGTEFVQEIDRIEALIQRATRHHFTPPSLGATLDWPHPCHTCGGDGGHESGCPGCRCAECRPATPPASEPDPLRLCSYCRTWRQQPCGEGCAWGLRDPTFEEERDAMRRATPPETGAEHEPE